MRFLPFAPEVDRVTEFNRVRGEEPVCRVLMPSGDIMWLISRYEDVKRVFADPRFSRDLTAPGAPRTLPDGDWSENPLSMVNMDGERHGARRRPVLRHLSARKVETLRQATVGLVRELLEEMIVAGGPAEFVESFAVPMPALSAALVLGIPESDYAFFRRDVWPLAAPDQFTRSEWDEATRKVYEYAVGLAELKRAEPGDDMTTVFVEAADSGESAPDLLPMLIMEIMFAGMLNTRSVLCSGMLELLRDRALFQAVATDEELCRNFTEEALRCFSHPTIGLPRLALEDVELGGEIIPKGEAVLPALMAANRDPAVYADPDVVDPERRDPPHLAFGHGPHHCIGAALSRMQLQVAFTEIARRLPGMRLAEPEAGLPWHRTLLEHSVARMPVTW